MKIVPTRRTDYAIRALIYLAAQKNRAKAEEIGAEMGIPKPVLHQVLKELTKPGLVTSLAGPHGGYQLARDASTVTLLEIVEALEGSVHLDQCALEGGPCHWEPVCALHAPWTEARQAFALSLAAHTLAEVAQADGLLRGGLAMIPPDSHRYQTDK